MSERQDRVAPRTAQDIERKYSFGKRFSEILGLIDETQDKVDSTASSLRNTIENTKTSLRRNTKEIVAEAKKEVINKIGDEYYDKEEFNSQFQIKADEISSKVQRNYEKVASRGEQLITNGTGALGDNTNFSQLSFDSAECNNSSGSFTYETPGKSIEVLTDEFFPVNAARGYTLSFDAKSREGKANLHGIFYFYDADKNKIDVGYKFGISASPVSTDWHTYAGRIEGIDYTGGKANMFPPGTVYAKVLFLWNSLGADDLLWVTNVSVQDTTDLFKLKEYAESSIKQTEDSITLSVNAAKEIAEGAQSGVTDVNTRIDNEVMVAIKEDCVSLSVYEEKVEEINGAISDVSNQVTSLDIEKDKAKISVIEQTLENGVKKVSTETGYTFDKDGLKISKSGDGVENLLDNTGMYVKSNGKAILTANTTGVEAMNAHIKTYLIIGSGDGRSRFEDYGTDRTGCFWIGG